ncbi:hypothetical protein CHL76_16340 [Marinococcus halophilus]|uniref:LysR family transcriptional regulator n=1 Tax=Marinococcus halophilus TaxID=1371 RepID=A0A510YAA3_MARHA|nr:LysR family transcriptional regulator [Marinococcus halophilus]OZT78743.1 hypothetical protein CHL76_16340 [Marinococcus halophilus]GEK60289.1 LysR family transcriptional regulator [Marinococcus halophilus]
MNIRMLDYFLAVAQEKNISRASKKLFISQPALSKQIKQLEHMLGFTLFVRSSHGMTLTHKGEKLYEDIEPLVSQLQSRMKKHTESRIIHIGADPLLASHYFPQHMETFMPFRIQLTHIKEDTVDLLPLLRAGSIDAAIVQDRPYYQGLSSAFLFHDEFFAAIPANHPLAQFDRLSMTQCFQYAQILTPFTPLYQRITRLMGDLNVQAPSIIEVPYNAIVGFVAQGYGISYLPSMIVQKVDYRGVVFIPLEDAPLHRDMYLFATDRSYLEILQKGLDL